MADADPTPPQRPSAMAPKVLLFHMERLIGCRPEILSFARWWAASGPFPVTIPRDGGFRVDEERQRRLYERKASRALRLQDTPHGRGAALDIAPVRLLAADGLPVRIWTAAEHTPGERAEAIRLYSAFGQAVSEHGLVWGGTWRGIVDLGHAELQGWRSLPFPPHLEAS